MGPFGDCLTTLSYFWVEETEVHSFDSTSDTRSRGDFQSDDDPQLSSTVGTDWNKGKDRMNGVRESSKSTLLG